MARRYPLEPLQGQREHAVEQQTAELAERLREVQQATADHAHAQRRYEQAQAAAKAARHAEAARVAVHGARVEDLAQAARFATRTRQDIEQLQRNQQMAAEHLARALAARAEQQAKLAEAAGQAKAVETHRERWEEEGKRLARKAEDESAQDQWLARHPRTGHS